MAELLYPREWEGSEQDTEDGKPLITGECSNCWNTLAVPVTTCNVCGEHVEVRMTDKQRAALDAMLKVVEETVAEAGEVPCSHLMLHLSLTLDQYQNLERLLLARGAVRKANHALYPVAR